ncbi:MAG: magnesium transporter [Candidatus Obscuribacterales bacterium]|nr:magnesium transporter [Candidatus Obscuribacterales bacterium]
MITEQTELSVETIRSLLEASDRQRLRLVLNDQHPADIAVLIAELNKEERLSCFRILDLDNASEVLAELEADISRELLHELGNRGVVPIIMRMAPDEAADLLSELPEAEATSIISQIGDDESAQDIKELMSFEEDSAGGIMSNDYLALESSMTASDALARLRETYEELDEEIYDVYVVDENDHLVGRVSVRELLTADPDIPVESIMDADVFSVNTDTDQEEAADKLSHYDVLSLPVVDKEGKLKGIITADDVLDVLEEEATEDIYESSGINVPEMETSEALTYNLPLAFRARLPWLVVTLLIETGSVLVITHFDHMIQQTVAAASFMPLLSGVTGSVATQSTCIMIRGTATGHFNWSLAWRNTWHEARVGALLGLACGFIAWSVSVIMHAGHPTALGVIVGFSLCLTMTVGVLIGTVTPMMFHRLGIDPAHASGPLITSILDVCTMTIYLSIVHICLTQLL